MTFPSPSRALMLSAEGTAAITHALEKAELVHFSEPYATVVFATTMFLAGTFTLRIGIPLALKGISIPLSNIAQLCDHLHRLHGKGMTLFEQAMVSLRKWASKKVRDFSDWLGR